MTTTGVDPIDVRRFERRAMGSPLRLTAADLDQRQSIVAETDSHRSQPADGTDVIEAAWSAVSESFEAAEAAMSRFRETSDLTTINRPAGIRANGASRPPAGPCPRCCRSGRASDRGRFDARVLGDLERLGYRGVPVQPDGGRTGPTPGNDQIVVDGPLADRGCPVVAGRRPDAGRPRRDREGSHAPVGLAGHRARGADRSTDRLPPRGRRRSRGAPAVTRGWRLVDRHSGPSGRRIPKGRHPPGVRSSRHVIDSDQPLARCAGSIRPPPDRSANG